MKVERTLMTEHPDSSSVIEPQLCLCCLLPEVVQKTYIYIKTAEMLPAMLPKLICCDLLQNIHYALKLLVKNTKVLHAYGLLIH